jgi:hypothetical protein
MAASKFDTGTDTGSFFNSFAHECAFGCTVKHILGYMIKGIIK